MSSGLFVRKLRAALKALNTGLPTDSCAQAIEQFTQDRSEERVKRHIKPLLLLIVKSI